MSLYKYYIHALYSFSMLILLFIWKSCIEPPHTKALAGRRGICRRCCIAFTRAVATGSASRSRSIRAIAANRALRRSVDRIRPGRTQFRRRWSNTHAAGWANGAGEVRLYRRCCGSAYVTARAKSKRSCFAWQTRGRARGRIGVWWACNWSIRTRTCPSCNTH